MTETGQNIIIYKGDDAEISCTVTDGHKTIPISGAVINWDMYNIKGDLVTGATLNDYITIDDEAHGLFTLKIPAAITANYKLGRYEHKCTVTLNGLRKTIFTGNAYVKITETR